MSLIFCLNKRAGNIYHKVHVLTKLRLVSTTSIAYVASSVPQGLKIWGEGAICNVGDTKLWGGGQAVRGGPKSGGHTRPFLPP